jgi:hypothetical protein
MSDVIVVLYSSVLGLVDNRLNVHAHIERGTDESKNKREKKGNQKFTYRFFFFFLKTRDMLYF